MIYFFITYDILNVSIETYARNISLYITIVLSKMTSVFGVFKFSDFGWKCTQVCRWVASDRLSHLSFYEIIT